MAFVEEKTTIGFDTSILKKKNPQSGERSDQDSNQREAESEGNKDKHELQVQICQLIERGLKKADLDDLESAFLQIQFLFSRNILNLNERDSALRHLFTKLRECRDYYLINNSAILSLEITDPEKLCLLLQKLQDLNSLIDDVKQTILSNPNSILDNQDEKQVTIDTL